MNEVLAVLLETTADAVEAKPGLFGFKFDEPLNVSINRALHQKIADYLGITTGLNGIKKLGEGGFGVAYKMLDGRVLKITSDGSEAKASARLVGKENQTIAAIYDVFEFRPYPHLSMFGIVQEFLTKPDPEWEEFANLWSMFRTDPENAMKVGQREMFETPITEKNIKWFQQWATPLSTDETDQVMIPWMKLLAKELKASGIKYRDLHTENIMKRPNGDHVIIDLGASKMTQKGSKPIKLVSKVVRAAGLRGPYDFLMDDDDSDDGAGDFYMSAPINAHIGAATHEAILKHLGLPPDKTLHDLVELGSGSYGTAIDLGNGKVLKVTADATEASSSMLLVGAHNQTIATIYDVFEFQTESGRSLYGILQEKLISPKPDWFDLATAWWVFRSDPALIAQHGREWFETPLTAKNVEAFLKWAIKDKMVKRLCGLMFKSNKIPADKIEWLSDAVKELAASGITFRDLHGKNIMQRPNGDHVIIDLGKSVSKAVTIPKLESLVPLQAEAHTVTATVYFEDPINAILLHKDHQNISSYLGYGRRLITLQDALGHGSFGIAFPLTYGDFKGKVLKITTDPTEAAAGFNLIGKSFDTIYKVEDVFLLADTVGRMNHERDLIRTKMDLYGIIQERLVDITPSWAQLGKDWWAFRNDKSRPANVQDIDNFREPINEQSIEEFSEWAEARNKEVKPDHLEWLHKLAADLDSAKIKFGDLHEHNMMLRDGKPVVIDLGISRSAPVTIPNIGEDVKFNEAESTMNIATMMEHAASLIEGASSPDLSDQISHFPDLSAHNDEPDDEADATDLVPGDWTETTYNDLEDAQKAALWKMIQDSYKDLKGGSPVKAPADLLNPKYKLLTLWDATNDNIPNAFIFKRVKPAGNKMFMSGTDGQKPSKRASVGKLLEMLKGSGWYAELSDRPAELLEENGFHRWDDEAFVREVLEGEDITWLGDGYYERDITGVGRHKKALYGRPFGKPLP